MGTQSEPRKWKVYEKKENKKRSEKRKPKSCEKVEKINTLVEK